MEALIQKAAIVLNPNIKRYKYDKINEILNSEFPINYAITDTKMSSLSLVASMPEPTAQHKVHNKKLIETILWYKPDLNHCDNFGRTALHFAARIGNMTALACLIEVGHPVTNEEGETK